MTNKLRLNQVLNSAGVSLETLLAGFPLTSSAGSITLPDGTILKYGTLASIANITANNYSTQTLIFPVAFPNSCEFFHALYTPNSSADFYGVNSLVSKSKTQVQYTVKNGGTAQGCSGGIYFAVGK